MKLQEIVNRINNDLPLRLIEDEDNVGLISGNYDDECERMTVAYELNEDVVREASQSHSNLIITYHTPLFRATKNFISSASKVEPLFEATRSNINVFAVHTAIDILKEGVNFDLASRLGLKDVRFLFPLRDTFYKVVVFVPRTHLDAVRRAMSNAGAGRIGNYFECSFVLDGKGSFVSSADSSPYIGERGKFEVVDEARLEMVVEKPFLGAVVAEMLKAHPYEEVAYDIYHLANDSVNYGFGAIGKIETATSLREFLEMVKDVIGVSSLRVSKLTDMDVNTVALCAGSGARFYDYAVKNSADVFVTGDVKHHDFREAKNRRTVLVDATHQGTEKFVVEVLSGLMRRLFVDRLGIEVSNCKNENFITV
jgi:dinuclear metal center YbgI/SA1388 family protein